MTEQLQRALEDARVDVDSDHPLWPKLVRAYDTARAHGIDAPIAARWAVVRVTQVVPLHARAKRV